MTRTVATPLVSVAGLRKSYRTRHGELKAVDGVSFSIARGETLAVVGESGCGKSTLAMALLGLIPSDAGTIAVDGNKLSSLANAQRKHSSCTIGVVFQNPHSSLNPKMKVRAIVAEPLITALDLRGKALTERVLALLKEVGLGPEHINRYPHKLSGGQLQRVAIARALALQPKLLILDEPTAALDVSVQAQILKLLKTLQAESGISYLFITHDLGTVDYLADRIIVMYLGRIVESGPVDVVFAEPRHPYTQALLEAVPTIDPQRRGHFAALSGEIPSPLNRPRGCAFAPRCRRRDEQCHHIEPAVEQAEPNRAYACHHPLSAKQ